MMPPRQPLRIALAIAIYEPDAGGAAEWVRAYALWLQRRGHDVWIVCERSGAAASQPIPLLTLPQSGQTKNSWRRAVALQRLVGSKTWDVVHDSGQLLKADVFHPLMGSLIHNWYRQLKSFPPGLRLRRCFQIRLWRDVRLQLHQQRQPQILVACSTRVAADFARLGCLETAIVRNGIPPAPDLPVETLQSLRQQLKVGSRLLVVVTATNFYLKGVAKVLEALVRLGAVDRKKFLVVVTGQAQSDVFQHYIDRHRLGDDCRLLGWVPQIDDYYQAADIFLHPTYHDAGSLSTLKALAAGRAVVTSRFDGSADWITDRTNGLILKEPADAGEIAETLMQLTDDARRQRLGLAARELAPRIHQEHQFSKLEELYGRIRPSPRRTK
jgi:glycosyltransferase involved in cell wall biosynthesis